MGDQALSLAWGQYSLKYEVTPDASQAVQSLACLLGSTHPHQRAYFGSSAGGFMALSLLFHDPEARALVNNAQFDWTRWFAPAVNSLRRARLDNRLPADLRKKYPKRTNVLKLLASLSNSPRVDYWVNMESDHDRSIDHPEFEAFRREYPKTVENMLCHKYRDPDAGHNPLSKSQTLAILRMHNSQR